MSEPMASGPEVTRAVVPTAGFVTVDADGQDIPVDLAAWIDERDPEPEAVSDPAVEAPETRDAADVALDEQRLEHEPEDRDANDAVGALVNNTGDDGGAASG